MYCRKCGSANDDNAYKCTACGEVLQVVPTRKINNYLVLAIVVTVLCCLPFGIVGIVYAAQVNARAQGGDIAGAEESARKARFVVTLGPWTRPRRLWCLCGARARWRDG